MSYNMKLDRNFWVNNKQKSVIEEVYKYVFKIVQNTIFNHKLIIYLF